MFQEAGIQKLQASYGSGAQKQCHCAILCCGECTGLCVFIHAASAIFWVVKFRNTAVEYDHVDSNVKNGHASSHLASVTNFILDKHQAVTLLAKVSLSLRQIKHAH